MNNGLPLFWNRNIQDVLADYGEVLYFYNTRNCILLNTKLHELEQKYRAELFIYNAFRPARYLSLDEQAWECMDLLMRLVLFIRITREMQKTCKSK